MNPIGTTDPQQEISSAASAEYQVELAADDMEDESLLHIVFSVFLESRA